MSKKKGRRAHLFFTHSLAVCVCVVWVGRKEELERVIT